MSCIAVLIMSTLFACDLKVPPDRSADSGDTAASEVSNENTLDGGASDTGIEDTANTNDTDSGSSSGGDTPTQNCTTADLTFQVRVLTETGDAPASPVAEGDSLRVWSQIENTCDNPVVYTTDKNCLISEWRMENRGSNVVASGMFPCGGPSGNRTIEPFSSLRQEVAPLYDLPPNDFTVFVTWGGGQEESTAFSVAR